MKQCTIYLFSMWLLSLKLFYIRHDMTLFSHKKGNLDIILYYLSIKYGRWDLLIVFSSVQFRCTVMSNSLRPHGLQYARLPCPSTIPGACSNLCPLSWRCHPTISSSVVPFSSCLQSFPASGSFPMSQFFASVGQSIGVSAS